MEILKGIKNIIFDFGGVIIDIDYHLTRDAFIGLGIKNFDEIYSQGLQKPLFDNFETGKISEEEFFQALESLLPNPEKRELLVAAWNAMLLGFPEENLELLKRLKSEYRTFLLSNTNETHLSFYFNKIKNWYRIGNMDPLFEKAYYSCRIGLRKPDTAIFEYLLKEHNLNATETLFIDDSIQHIHGAEKTGIRAFHLAGGMKVGQLFPF